MFPVAVTDQFVYLGSTGYSSTDILRRVGLASSTMGQLDRVWRQNRLSLATKLRIYTTCVLARGVARNLIWVGINCTISNLSWIKETKQPHKKFKVDLFGGGGVTYRYTPRRYAPGPGSRRIILIIRCSKKSIKFTFELYLSLSIANVIMTSSIMLLLEEGGI